MSGVGSDSTIPGSRLGTIAVLVGAFSWSVGIIYSRRSRLSGNPLLLSALSLLSGAACSLWGERWLVKQGIFP